MCQCHTPQPIKLCRVPTNWKGLISQKVGDHIVFIMFFCNSFRCSPLAAKYLPHRRSIRTVYLSHTCSSVVRGTRRSFTAFVTAFAENGGHNVCLPLSRSHIYGTSSTSSVAVKWTTTYRHCLSIPYDKCETKKFVLFIWYCNSFIMHNYK